LQVSALPPSPLSSSSLNSSSCSFFSFKETTVSLLEPLLFFLILILFGSLLSYISNLSLIGEPTLESCSVQIWFSFGGFSISFTSLVAKNWRIWKLYNGPLNKDIVLKDIDLLKYMAFSWIILSVILVVWSSIFMPIPEIILSPPFKVCHYEPVIAYIALSYVGILVLGGVSIALKTRHIPEQFREAKWIGLGIYNFLVFLVITVPLSMTTREFDLTLSFTILTVGLLFWTSGIWMFLILPKLYLIYVEGNSNSTKSHQTPQFTTTSTKSGGPTQEFPNPINLTLK